jgi:hypothetical protein
VDFGVLIFFLVIALVIRAVVKSASSRGSSKSSGSADKLATRRRRLQEFAQRMRATAQPGSTAPYSPPPTAQPGSTAPYSPPPTAQPGSTAPFAQPTLMQPPPIAPVAPPTEAFTATWPTGAPTPPQSPPRRQSDDPVVVDVAVDPAPLSAYPLDDPTSDAEAASSPTPSRHRYELSSSLDTTLSTSLSSSVIGESGSVVAGPQVLSMSDELRARVLELMDQGYEVMAVRLVCDEMDAGILEAQKTVRSAAGLPTLI